MVSVLLPFRPLGWKVRWRSRATWPHFALCLSLPYVLLYVLLSFWHLPERSVARALLGAVRDSQLNNAIFALAWGLATSMLGLLLAEL